MNNQSEGKYLKLRSFFEHLYYYERETDFKSGNAVDYYLSDAKLAVY